MSPSGLLLDASCLIALARLGLIQRVNEQVSRVHATPEVISEATVADRPGAAAVTDAIEQGHLSVLEPAAIPALSGLGSGETATIRSAAQLGLTAVIDDLDARRAATRLGIRLTGTIALLVRVDATDPERPLTRYLDELDVIGFRVAPSVRDWALKAARRSG